MADSASATSTTGTPNDVTAPPPSGGEQSTDARSQNQSKGGGSKQTLEQMAKQAARKGATPSKQPQNQEVAEQQTEVESEFDFDGEKYTREQLADIAKKRREYDKAASLRMEEAAKIRKQANADLAEFKTMLEQFKQNPWALIEHAGLNPDEIAEQRLAQQLKRHQMSPEAIELEKARAELQKIQQEKQQIEDTTKKQAHEQRVAYWDRYFNHAIGSALESKNLPRIPFAAERVRGKLGFLVEAGHQMDDAAVAMAVDMAKQDAMDETQFFLGELAKGNPKALVEMLGGLDGDIVKAIQRQAVERHESVNRPKPVQQQPKPQPQKPKGPPTLEDVRKQLGIA